MNLHCLNFFQSQKFKIMSDSCHFHGSFMALSHTSLTWVQSAKIYWKSYPKSRCWLSICSFCLISASFLAICQIHVGFMALSWHFPGAFFLLIYIVFQAVSWHLHVRFMADSSRIHRGFMPVSFNPKKSKSCQIHVTFMAVSWHFHIQVLPGYGLPKSIGKSYPKSRCWLSIWFFLPNFSFIFGNMSDSCRFHGPFHGPFMALSSF